MDKRLLLLGVLRTQDLHGYGLMDYLDAHAMGGVAIGRSNAYRLLRAMEKDGWIKSHTEQDRNRPMRQVYSVTRKGEAEFQRLLRDGVEGGWRRRTAVRRLDEPRPGSGELVTRRCERPTLDRRRA